MDNDFQVRNTYPQSNQPSPQKHKPWKWLIIALVVVVVLFGIGLAVLMAGSKTDTKTTSKHEDDSAATSTLFNSLSKAASQPNIRVAMLRQSYATKADLASNTDPGFIQSSVSELSPQKFRTVYAQRLYDKQTFTMQRCIDGTAYVDGLGAGLGRVAPKSLGEANEYLKQMYKVNEALQFIVCPHVGVMPGGTLDLTPARLSDGVMPVTFSSSQADKWKTKVISAKLFNVKDEGMTTREGKQLRKFSLTPRDNRTDINKQLYDIFYETGEIDKIKRDQPKAEWQYEFITINPANGGSIQGYYLIDETTGLPVYSELEGLNSDRDKSNSTSKANLGFHKQTYAYPTTMSLEVTSPLEFLQ